MADVSYLKEPLAWIVHNATKKERLWRTRQTLWGDGADANPKLLPNDTWRMVCLWPLSPVRGSIWSLSSVILLRHLSYVRQSSSGFILVESDGIAYGLDFTQSAWSHWYCLSSDNAFHQPTIQTIGWQSDGSQLPVCQSITMKNQMVWQFLGNSWFLLKISVMATFTHID